MKITFVISSLLGGGAERVVSNMATYWADKGWDITIFTLFHGSQPVCYDLHPKVRHLDLLNSTHFNFPRPDAQSALALRELFDILTPSERKEFLRDITLIVAMRHAIKRTLPDLVISFLDATNIRVLIATHGLNFPVVVSERSDPRQISTGREGWDRLRHRLYPRANGVVLLDEESLSYFSPDVQARCRVIPNPAFPTAVSAAKEETARDGKKTLLAMGRLDTEKGFDFLLQAFSRVAPRQPAWSLDIWGQGPLRATLEALANDLNLGDRVRFRGFTQHPIRVMQRADLFVMASRFEGFPNVLLEAMACGLPVVTFNCPTGPGKIIRHGIDGVLVPPSDVGALIATLDRMMGDEAERKRLAGKAPEVIERFSVERVMGMWEDLIRGLESNG